MDIILVFQIQEITILQLVLKQVFTPQAVVTAQWV